MGAGEGLGEKHVLFTAWAKEQGVEINGIEAAQLPGKGIGIVASRPIKVSLGRTNCATMLTSSGQAGEVIARAPAGSLITTDCAIAKQVRLPADATVHCWLAIALMQASDAYKLWRETWPSATDFESSMPLCWDHRLQSHLPEGARALLEKQQSKFDRDWAVCQSVLPDARIDDFRYHWLVVNTRCFFWEHAKPKPIRSRKRARHVSRSGDDCMALTPFADYFNHSDGGCTFDSTRTGCFITADRDYAEAEEVTMNYGGHSNDFLLVEYGFLMDTNKYDSIKLDGLVLPMLVDDRRGVLETHGYLGNYTLDADGVCFRTQAALRAQIRSKRQLEKFLNGSDDGDADDKKATEVCARVVRRGIEQADATLGELRGPNRQDEGDEARRKIDTMERRWAQIRSMLLKSACLRN